MNVKLKIIVDEQQFSIPSDLISNLMSYIKLKKEEVKANNELISVEVIQKATNTIKPATTDILSKSIYKDISEDQVDSYINNFISCKNITMLFNDIHIANDSVVIPKTLLPNSNIKEAKVKWINNQKGYAYISDETGKKFFVSDSALDKYNQYDSIPYELNIIKDGFASYDIGDGKNDEKIIINPKEKLPLETGIAIISLLLSFIAIVLDIYFHESDRLDDKRQETNTYIEEQNINININELIDSGEHLQKIIDEIYEYHPELFKDL